MKLFKFIMKIKGNNVIKIYKEYGTRERELIKEGTVERINEDMNMSFNALEGFDDEMWEKEILEFVIRGNIIAILIGN